MEKDIQRDRDEEREFENKETLAESEKNGADAIQDADSDDTISVDEQSPVKTELKKLQDELADSKAKYLRLYAEFENFRKRTSKEKLEMMLTANEALLVSLLPVSDDFERAERSLRDKKDDHLEGFSLIHSKFKKVLEHYGVKAMEVKAGDDFNADFHEAINQRPAPDEKLKGKVIEVVENGYLLNDKVIRFAKVVVGS